MNDMTILEYAEKLYPSQLSDYQKQILVSYQQAQEDGKTLFVMPGRMNGRTMIKDIIDRYQRNKGKITVLIHVNRLVYWKLYKEYLVEHLPSNSVKIHSCKQEIEYGDYKIKFVISSNHDLKSYRYDIPIGFSKEDSEHLTRYMEYPKIEDLQELVEFMKN